jgi:hypothetical protein
MWIRGYSAGRTDLRAARDPTGRARRPRQSPHANQNGATPRTGSRMPIRSTQRGPARRYSLDPGARSPGVRRAGSGLSGALQWAVP